MELLSFNETLALADHAAKSGYFDKCRTASQALMKITLGRELGFGAAASLVGIYIIEGKPQMSAHLMAAMVQRSGQFRYRVLEHSEENCRLEFFENETFGQKDTKPVWVSLGVAGYSIEEADRSGVSTGEKGRKTNWARHPKAMLFARAVSAGYRTYTPSLTSGAAVYTREEMEDEMLNMTPEMAAPPPTETIDAPAIPVEQNDQPAPGLTDDQLKSLSDKINAIQAAKGSVNMPAMLAYFKVRTFGQMSREQYNEACFMLGDKLAKCLESNPPTTQPPVKPSVEPIITQDEYNSLIGMIETVEKSGGVVNKAGLLEHFKITNLGTLPQHRFPDLMMLLKAKLEKAVADKKSPITDEQAAARKELCDQIDAAVTTLNYDAAAFKGQVKAVWGTDDVLALTMPQLAELAARLNKKVAELPNQTQAVKGA
jgi:RecT family